MLYTVQDSAADAPTVESQAMDPSSLYTSTKEIIALRHAYEDLQADASFQVINDYRHFLVYQRGSMICAVNPSKDEVTVINQIFRGRQKIYGINQAEVQEDTLRLGAGSFIVLK